MVLRDNHRSWSARMALGTLVSLVCLVAAALPSARAADTRCPTSNPYYCEVAAGCVKFPWRCEEGASVVSPAGVPDACSAFDGFDDCGGSTYCVLYSNLDCAFEDDPACPADFPIQCSDGTCARVPVDCNFTKVEDPAVPPANATCTSDFDVEIPSTGDQDIVCLFREECEGCPNDCGSTGSCVDRLCECQEGFGGNDCSEAQCPTDCGPHGVCNGTTLTCTCSGGYCGPACTIGPPPTFSRAIRTADGTGVQVEFTLWTDTAGEGVNVPFDCSNLLDISGHDVVCEWSDLAVLIVRNNNLTRVELRDNVLRRYDAVEGCGFVTGSITVAGQLSGEIDVFIRGASGISYCASGDLVLEAVVLFSSAGYDLSYEWSIVSGPHDMDRFSQALSAATKEGGKVVLPFGGDHFDNFGTLYTFTATITAQNGFHVSLNHTVMVFSAEDRVPACRIGSGQPVLVVARGDEVTLDAVAERSHCVDSALEINIEWIFDSVNHTGPVLDIPAHTLAANGIYAVEMYAFYTGSGVQCSASALVSVAPLRLTPKIVGGHRRSLHVDNPVVLDASTVSSPDETSGDLSYTFTWTCTFREEGEEYVHHTCFSYDYEPLVIPDEAVVTVDLLTSGIYTFTVVVGHVSSGSVGVASQEIQIVESPSAFPTVLIDSFPDTPVSADAILRFQGATKEDTSTPLLWSLLDSDDDEVLSTTNMRVASPTLPVLVVHAPDDLDVGRTYRFLLSSEGGYSEVSLAILLPPAHGAIEAILPVGQSITGLTSVVDLECTGWHLEEPDAGPLKYQFLYSLYNEEDEPVYLWLSEWIYNNRIRRVLPPGIVRVRCMAMDSSGGMSQSDVLEIAVSPTMPSFDFDTVLAQFQHDADEQAVISLVMSTGLAFSDAASPPTSHLVDALSPLVRDTFERRCFIAQALGEVMSVTNSSVDAFTTLEASDLINQTNIDVPSSIDISEQTSQLFSRAILRTLGSLMENAAHHIFLPSDPSYGERFTITNTVSELLERVGMRHFYRKLCLEFPDEISGGGISFIAEKLLGSNLLQREYSFDGADISVLGTVGLGDECFLVHAMRIGGPLADHTLMMGNRISTVNSYFSLMDEQFETIPSVLMPPGVITMETPSASSLAESDNVECLLFDEYEWISSGCVPVRVSEDSFSCVCPGIGYDGPLILARVPGCLNDCNGNGMCDQSQDPPRCLCDDAFEGTDCSDRACRNITNCGDCINDDRCAWAFDVGLCVKQDSDDPVLLISEFLVTDSCPTSFCPNNCSDHGSCALIPELGEGEKRCVCESGYAGASCDDCAYLGVLDSAYYEETYANMIVTFTHDTDLAGKTLGVKFDCDDILLNTTTGMECMWSDRRTLVLLLPTLEIGIPLVLRDARIGAYPLQVAGCEYINGSVVISGDSPPTPWLEIKAPSRISNCDHLSMAVDVTAGTAGRSFEIDWQLVTSSGDPSVDTALTEALTSAHNMTSVTIAADTFTGFLGSIEIRATVTNAFGISGAAEALVLLVGDAVPIVTIEGLSTQAVYRPDSIEVFAKARASCGSSRNLTFSWGFSPTSPNTFSLEGVETHTASLRFPPNTLQVRCGILTCVYQLRVSVTQQGSSEVGTADVTLLMVFSPLEAFITGGNRAVGQAQELVLNATASSDPDMDPVDPPVFHWSCSEMIYGLSVQCPGVTFTETSNVLQTIPANTLGLGPHDFTVTFSKGSREAVYSVTITVVDGTPLPVVAWASKVVFNNNEPIRLFGSVEGEDVNGTFNVYEWSDVNGVLELSEEQLLGTGRNSPSLTIRPGILLGDSKVTHTFKLFVNNTALGKTGEASVSFSVDSPPSGGSLTVQAESGETVTTLTSSTLYTLICTGWTDTAQDLPLQYTFWYGEGSTPSRYVALSEQQSASSLDAILPPPSTGVEVTLACDAMDRQGSVSRATIQVHVTDKFEDQPFSAIENEYHSRLADAKQHGDPAEIVNVIGTFAATIRGQDGDDPKSLRDEFLDELKGVLDDTATLGSDLAALLASTLSTVTTGPLTGSRNVEATEIGKRVVEGVSVADDDLVTDVVSSLGNLLEDASTEPLVKDDTSGPQLQTNVDAALAELGRKSLVGKSCGETPAEASSGDVHFVSRRVPSTSAAGEITRSNVVMELGQEAAGAVPGDCVDVLFAITPNMALHANEPINVEFATDAIPVVTLSTANDGQEFTQTGLSEPIKIQFPADTLNLKLVTESLFTLTCAEWEAATGASIPKCDAGTTTLSLRASCSSYDTAQQKWVADQSGLPNPPTTTACGGSTCVETVSCEFTHTTAYALTLSLDCDDPLCGGQGTCVNSTLGNPVCDCNDGYDGLSCETHLCVGETTCTGCQNSHTSCGWCESSKKCLFGDATGPLLGSETCSDANWYLGETCPASPPPDDDGGGDDDELVTALAVVLPILAVLGGSFFVWVYLSRRKRDQVRYRMRRDYASGYGTETQMVGAATWGSTYQRAPQDNGRQFTSATPPALQKGATPTLSRHALLAPEGPSSPEASAPPSTATGPQTVSRRISTTTHALSVPGQGETPIRVQKGRTIDELISNMRKRTALPRSADEEQAQIENLRHEIEEMKKMTFFWMNLAIKLNVPDPSNKPWETLFEGAIRMDLPVDEWPKFISAEQSTPHPSNYNRQYDPAMGDPNEEFLRNPELIRRTTFRWMTLALKLNRAKFGQLPANVDWETLYERANQQRIPIKFWPVWIDEQLETVEQAYFEASY